MKAEDTGYSLADRRKSLRLNHFDAHPKAGLSRDLSRDLYRVAISSIGLHTNSGQKRDKYVGWFFGLASLLPFVFAIVRESQSKRRHRQLLDEARLQLDLLCKEFHQRLPREQSVKIGAAYIRYSTDKQDSFASQLRIIFEAAIKDRIFVPKENVFFDLGISGGKTDREGLNLLREKARQRVFQCLLAFSTSRLARNLQTLLMVLNDELVANGVRCLIVDQSLDSDDRQKWDTWLPLLGVLDQWQRTSTTGNIVASHIKLLAAGMCYGTLSYGFRGEPLAGSTTKLGNSARKMAIDKVEADVVRRIFQMFCNENLSLTRIAKILTEDHSLPRPRKSTTSRFTPEFVVRALKNERYLGIFDYQRKNDLSNRMPDEMRSLACAQMKLFSFPELQIISDELFCRARALLLNNKDQFKESRKAIDGDKKSRPLLFRQMLRCEACDRWLVVGGSNGKYFHCKSCLSLPDQKRNLFSVAQRELSTKLIVEAICEQVLSDPDVVDRAVQATLTEIRALQRHDPSRLDSLTKSRLRIERKVVLVLKTIGDDVKKDAFFQSQLKELHAEKSKVDSEIMGIRLAMKETPQTPDEDEVRRAVQHLPAILMEVSEDEASLNFDRVRNLLREITGGSIRIVQAGEKRAKRGWLQAIVTVDLSKLYQHSKQSKSCSKDVVELTVDLKKPQEANPLVTRVMTLFRDGKLQNEIAQELSCSPSTVHRLLTTGLDAEDKSIPSGRDRAKKIMDARNEQRFRHQQISELVFEMAESGKLLVEIARELETNRNTVSDALNYARQQRGLPKIDGRKRRSTLDHKSRQSD